MAKKRTDGLTAQEAKDLESVGYVEGNPNTIPDNVSPVIKARIMEAWRKENDVESYSDLPNATERQNELARERADAEEDGSKPQAKRQNEI